MAGAGRKVFVNGDVLRASEVNDYLMDQAVQSFANATARDAALGVGYAGAVAYLQDKFAITVSTSGWSTIDLHAWTAYTPTVSGITIGNGTFSASYARVGKNVTLKVRFTLGSTSAITGAATFSLPVNATGFGYGTANLNCAGSNYQGVALISGSTNVIANAVNSAGTYAVQSSTSATIPATWATGNVISLTISYEAA